MLTTVLGHDAVFERFRRTLANGRLASTYLFVGPAGVGKRLLARHLAGALLCRVRKDDQLSACGSCASCQLVAAGNHPDLLTVSLPEDKNVLSIDLFVGDREHRHQTGLCHDLSLRPAIGNRRVGIIDDADHLNQESANCLLKTLEEPPPGSLLILIGTSPSRQLPTIRSRAQLVRFQPLQEELLAQLIESNGLATSSAEAAQLASISDGSLERARRLADRELWNFREQLAQWLERRPIDAVRLHRATVEFVEAAGKEAALRRQRLRTVIDFAVEFYRRQLRSEFSEAAAQRLDDCLTALESVDRNANQRTLVQHWIGRLAA